MIEALLLRELGIIVLGAAGVSLLARLVNIPSIVAYMAAGLLVGPTLGFVSPSDEIHLLSDAGIALLLFVVGLELSLDRIREVGLVAIVAGLGQVLFTALGGFGLCLLLGFAPVEALFIAVALTFSSTVVVVKLLDQKREIDSVYGRIAVGILLVQDLVVIFSLTLIAGLGPADAGGNGAVWLGVLRAFLGMAVLLAFVIVAARWILPRLFSLVASAPEVAFIWALGWCFLLVLAAESLGLSLEIGAFLAGVSLAQLPHHGDLKRRTHPLMSFFLAIFFVSLGAQMDFADSSAVLWPAVALFLFVVAVKPLLFLALIPRVGYGARTSFLTAVTLAQISEFSFVLASLGLSAGWIGDEALSLISLVGFMTIGLSSYLILYNGPLYQRFEGGRILGIFHAPQIGKEGEESAEDAAPPADVIVVGMNALGRQIVEWLAERGERVLAVDTDPKKLENLPSATLIGDVEYASVLEEAGLREARLLVSALQIEDVNLLLAHRCREAGVPAVIHAQDAYLERELEELGVEHLIHSREAGVQWIADELRREGVL